MDSFLERLERGSLPELVMQAFVVWCVWEQALPAVKRVLEKIQLPIGINDLMGIQDTATLLAWSQYARASITAMRNQIEPLQVSTAEAVIFECSNMAQAAGTDNWDPDAVAFFAARICSWAGWAASDFRHPIEKTQAERQARQEQESHLQTLYRQYKKPD